MSFSPLSTKQVNLFQKKVWDYYKKHGRQLPWRETDDPYCIVVSEIMLQQTQVGRVLVKYEEFVKRFPSWSTLSCASVADVLHAWQGLGYNRRALALKKIAERVEDEFGGELPKDAEVLKTFPGIGPATASSVAAFAFNIPTVFIETNVRSVFIHFFFSARGGFSPQPEADELQAQKDGQAALGGEGHRQIHDKELLPLVEQTLDKKRARKWYWALMDYGTMLKEKHTNPSRRSAHHTKQSSFKESNRFIRGQIIKLLTKNHSLTSREIFSKIDRDTARIKRCFLGLQNEGFIARTKQTYSLVK